jgi:hypothetical protein
VIFAVRSSHRQQRTGRKGGQRRNWLWGVTSEIYLFERVLRVDVVMVASEIYLFERVLRVGVAMVTSEIYIPV